MTDNRTTELRTKLTERGVKYDVKALRETEWTVNGVIWHANEYDGKLNVYVRNNDMLLTPEQAIAATLGSERHAYEQRITGDGSDWGEIMRDAYDELMVAANESCTPEQMEQLADYIRTELRSEPVSMRTFDSMETALSIAEKEVEIEELRRKNDELNAELGSGTCELTETDSYSNANEVVHVLECSACGETCEHVNGSYPRCPHCGRKVVSA